MRSKLRTKILGWLTDPQSKIFLQFLNYILPLFNKLTRLFQSETTLVDSVYDQILKLYKDLISCFMKREVVGNIKASPSDPSNFLKLEDIILVQMRFHL